MLALSFALHISIITALFLIKTEPKRIFLPPAYTPVELVPPPVSVKKPQKKRVVKKKTATKRKKVKKKKAIIPTKKVEKKKPVKKTKKLAVKESPKKTRKKRHTVDETLAVEKTIKAIEERLKRKQEEEAVEETIERIARKRMLEEERRKKELEEIRAQLERFDRIVIRQKTTQQAPAVSKTFELELMEYYNTIAGLVHSNWVYPEIEDDNPEVVLSITIAKDGRLLAVDIEKGSGDALFDKSAIRAVRKSAPFPKLPPQLGERLEVGMRFCLKECQ